MTPSPDPLDPLLQRAASVPPPPGNLAPEVWRRIAAAEKSPAPAAWLARIEAVFSRPSFAIMFVIACTVLGLFLAQIRLSHLQSEQNFQLVRNYLRLIDPLFETAALPAAAAPRS